MNKKYSLECEIPKPVKGLSSMIFTVKKWCEIAMSDDLSALSYYAKKLPAITSSRWEQNNFLVDGDRMRRLTPIECERLQTLPDDYTGGVSDSQRYKMLGNGWTVDVVAHIFNGLKQADQPTGGSDD